jgi:hypothetical protein
MTTKIWRKNAKEWCFEIDNGLHYTEYEIEAKTDGLEIRGCIIPWTEIAEAKDTLNGGMPFARVAKDINNDYSVSIVEAPAYKDEQVRRNKKTQRIAHNIDTNGWEWLKKVFPK